LRAVIQGHLSPCYRMLVAALAPLLATAAPLVAQQSTLLVGVHVESNYSRQPGVQIGFSTPSLLGGGPRFTASASTTRLATASGSNALVEDRLQLSSAWYFRRQATLSPFVGIGAGYTRFDREDDEIFALLDNGAPLLSLLLGAEAHLGSRLRLNTHAGYSGLQSSTVYPFVWSIGVNYPLRQGAP
jgi:hypothetical protein